MSFLFKQNEDLRITLRTGLYFMRIGSFFLGVSRCDPFSTQQEGWSWRGFERKVFLERRHCIDAVADLAFRISEGKSLDREVTLGSADTLKILLTTTEGSKAKRPHQTFLQLRDSQSKLETSFVFQVKENGKGKLEIV